MSVARAACYRKANWPPPPPQNPYFHRLFVSIDKCFPNMGSCTLWDLWSSFRRSTKYSKSLFYVDHLSMVSFVYSTSITTQNYKLTLYYNIFLPFLPLGFPPCSSRAIFSFPLCFCDRLFTTQPISAFLTYFQEELIFASWKIEESMGFEPGSSRRCLRALPPDYDASYSKSLLLEY